MFLILNYSSSGKKHNISCSTHPWVWMSRWTVTVDGHCPESSHLLTFEPYNFGAHNFSLDKTPFIHYCKTIYRQVSRSSSQCDLSHKINMQNTLKSELQWLPWDIDSWTWPLYKLVRPYKKMTKHVVQNNTKSKYVSNKYNIDQKM